MRCWWAGSGQDEDTIQEETKATVRVLLPDQAGGTGKCVYTGKPAEKIAIFARAY